MLEYIIQAEIEDETDHSDSVKSRLAMAFTLSRRIPGLRKLVNQEKKEPRKRAMTHLRHLPWPSPVVFLRQQHSLDKLAKGRAASRGRSMTESSFFSLQGDNGPNSGPQSRRESRASGDRPQSPRLGSGVGSEGNLSAKELDSVTEGETMEQPLLGRGAVKGEGRH